MSGDDFIIPPVVVVLEKRIKYLEDQLAQAERVIEWYASERVWSASITDECDIINPDDVEKTSDIPGDYFDGKRTRQYFKEKGNDE